MWMQDGCKIYMDSYMASNGSCFMVTSTTFKNHLMEVGLTQDWKTMALQMLTTIGLFYFIMFEDPREWKFIEIAFDWGPNHIWLHTTLEGPWPHYMILEVSWDGIWTLSFGLSHFHGFGPLARVRSGPFYTLSPEYINLSSAPLTVSWLEDMVIQGDRIL